MGDIIVLQRDLADNPDTFSCELCGKSIVIKRHGYFYSLVFFDKLPIEIYAKWLRHSVNQDIDDFCVDDDEYWGKHITICIHCAYDKGFSVYRASGRFGPRDVRDAYNNDKPEALRSYQSYEKRFYGD